ncbi:MAG: DUF6036 family nucleotidyltransferase [Oscillospiraceae bacterium]|nr:DUF6036 family nucleotidyltransferase [Oscillospiraceae bacterium]
MSFEVEFTKETIDNYLKEFGKEFRRRNGTKTHADIILIGGASILINYDFRNMTTDADAVIKASSVMKEAIHCVADKFNLPRDWLNDDFKRTSSFSEKLFKVAKRYRTFSNILHVWTVAAEYLIAMKLMSGRQYKYDLSDVVGILWEHEKKSLPIEKETIMKAVKTLYNKPLPANSLEFINDVFASGNYEKLYQDSREIEREGRNIVDTFTAENPTVKGVSVDEIIEQARRKKPLM